MSLNVVQSNVTFHKIVDFYEILGVEILLMTNFQ